MTNDDDDDYMGDLARFLQPHELLPINNPVQKPTLDTLGLRKQEKRKLKLAQQQKEEDRNRSDALGEAISSSNKGFKMLQQMGYKPGAALGKHGQGSLEPIKVVVKRTRSGLGRNDIEKRNEHMKAKFAEFKRDVEKRKQAELKFEFQERRKTSWKGRKMLRDYRKARTALQHLEETQPSTELEGTEKEVVCECTESNLLNEKEEGDDKEDDSEEEIELQDLLDLLQRLRSEYLYCLYCGCQYDSVDALHANCPGLEEDDH